MRARPTKLAAGLVFGALALFGVGTNVQAGWVLVIAAVLLGFVLAGILLPLAALRHVEVTRDAPASARSGQRVGVTITLTNKSKGLRGLVGVHDHFCGEGWAVCGLLRPGQSRSFTDMRTGARRGIHTHGSIGLASGAPFGIVIAWRDFDVRTSTVVYPQVHPVRLPDPSTGAVRMVRRSDGDTASLREYRAGDPLRHVHWRSTARRGELMVREFEQSDPAKVIVVADRSSNVDVTDAIASAACSYARAALDAGLRVEVVCGQQLQAVSAHNSIDLWGASLTPADRPPPLSLPTDDEATFICIIAGEKRNVALTGGSALGTVVVVDCRSPEVAIPTSEATGVVEAFRSAGCRVQIVPATQELGPWLK